MSVSEKLSKLNLVSGDGTLEIFDELFQDILTADIGSEATFIDKLWRRYANRNPALNGNVFEGILATIFYRSGILPLYVQAKLSFVPNIDFDFVAYSEECGPVILSAKTSLRERYKQADLEGMMVRQVHRKAKSFLLTLDTPEADNVNRKISEGLVLGIDSVVVANDESFDALIEELQSYTYIEPGKIDVLQSSRLIK